MKVTVSKSLLNKAVQDVGRVITNKSPIPILSGIKIETNSSGMILTGSDSEITIQSFIPANQGEKSNMYITSSGNAVLLAKIFNEYVRKITVDELEIEVDDKFQGKITAQKTDLKIKGYDPEEYPQAPKFIPEQSLQISSDVLRDMIQQTVFAASTNEQTPVLTGVMVSLINGKLKFVATDRHRLAMLEQTVQNESSVQQLIVSARSLLEVSRLLPDQSVEVDIRYRDNQILFKFEQIQIFAKLLDGTYPDTDKIIQNSSNYSTELIVSTDAMIELMDRALILSKEEKGNVVKMYSLDTETIEITAVSADFGKFKESLPTRKPLNNPVRVSLNSKYMLDVLRALDSEHVVIGFSGEMNPLLIQPLEEAEDVRALHLIVPYRTAKED